MPRFGRRSKNRLKGVNPKLVNVLNEAIKIYDFTIIEGLRTKRRQKELYDQGKTKVLHSKHMDGLAVDVAPWPVNFEDIKRFFYLAGIIKVVGMRQGADIRWGGDWNKDQVFTSRGLANKTGTDSSQNFNDYVHFEIKP